MKKKALIIIILLLAVAAAGCTAPPDKNIQLNTIKLQTTITRTITTPHYTTATVTRTQTIVTTQTFINLITKTTTISKITTYTSTYSISTATNTIVTTTITLFMNALGDGQPNQLKFYVYKPTEKVTYTLSDSITITYTPYVEPLPGQTVPKATQSIIIISQGNTVTVYWPAESGTNPIETNFFKVLFRWWDYLYIQALSSLMPTQTEAVELYQYMKENYTYDTQRALSANNFYLPHEFISQKVGNDGDFAEFYAAMQYARTSNATIMIVEYSTNNYLFAFYYSGHPIVANLNYFENVQALANVYGIDPTVTYANIGTFSPLQSINVEKYSHQRIWFVNTIPNSVGMTVIETDVITGELTVSKEYAGSIRNNHVDFVEIVYNPTENYTYSYVGDTNTITRWYLGEYTTFTVRGKTLEFAGGDITLVPTIMRPILGPAFGNYHVTLATISNNTTIVRGVYYSGAVVTSFERTKILSTEWYAYTVVNTKINYTERIATGTIYYS